jgi:vanillate/3-O-methylgallate O-demethylase
MSKEIIDAFRRSPGGYHIGWGGPEYTDWKDEQMSWKKTCYIGDWNFLWTLLIEGPEALKLLKEISVNSFAKFDIEQAKHVVQCNEDGKVIAEGILMRLGEEKFVVQSTPAFYTGYKFETGRYNAKVWQEDWFKYQVQGPNALYVVEKVAGESIRDMRFMHYRKIHIKGREVLALRQGMAGEIGYELQGPREYAQEIYNAILEAGKEYGIRRLGRRTVMINHLEACYPTASWHYLGATFGKDLPGFREYIAKNFNYSWVVLKLAGSFEGNDIGDYYRSPVEMGWTKNIKFDHDFIGRKALEAEVANPKRTIVTLEFNSEDVIDIYASIFREGEPYDFMDIPVQEKWVLWADQVLKDGKLVGVSTVPGYSYYFRKVLSLTYIDVELRKPGTEVVIVWGNPGTPQKRIRATVAPAPYKKDNRRIDVTTLPFYLK